MRTQIVSVAAAASLALAVVSSASGQIVAAPLSPLIRPAPAVTAPVVFDEARAAAQLRALLADRGFDASVTRGPMLAVPPGAATPLDFDGDPELDAPLGPMQLEAYLFWTEGGGGALGRHPSLGRRMPG